MNLILFGPPGAGKGTQSVLLAEKLGMRQIGTGDLFRAAMKSGSTVGMEAKKFVDAGKLVPDSVVIGLVDEVLSGLNGKSFILDGFPRTVPQAQALETQLTKYGLVIGRALFLEVPRAILLQRLSGRRVCKNCGTTYHVQAKPSRVEGICDVCGGEVAQRKDDSGATIETRLQAYEESTSPLRDYFRKSGVYREVSGIGSAEDVFDRLKKALV